MENDINLNLKFAESEASKLIEKYGICAPEHIRLKDIAYDLGSYVVEGHLQNAAASLVKTQDFSTIRVSSVDPPERKRFSIAHEIGHIVLGHVHSMIQVCTQNDMMNWYETSQETQANFFASELILPKKLVEKRCDVEKVNFDPIRQIAQDFRASLTATAISFVRFCPERCAIIFSKDGKVKWFYKSPSWWSYINKGQKLDQRSFAYDFFNNRTLPDEPEEVDAEAWIETNCADEMLEHSIGSALYNFVLTLLWMPE